VEQGLSAVGLGAALQIDHPDSEQAVADHRAGRAQRVPQQRRLARARRADHEEALAAQVEQERAAVLVVPDIKLAEVDFGGGVGDGGGVEDVRERVAPLDDHRQHTGLPPADGDAFGVHRVGERGGVVRPSPQVLPADHPHDHGVDRRRHTADAQDARAQRLAGAAVVAGQLALVEQPGPPPAPVDRPAPPGRADARGGPPVERGRMRPPPHHQHQNQAAQAVAHGHRAPPVDREDGGGGQEQEQRVAAQPVQRTEFGAGLAGRAAHRRLPDRACGCCSGTCRHCFASPECDGRVVVGTGRAAPLIAETREVWPDRAPRRRRNRGGGRCRNAGGAEMRSC
jgi:hypothetical protein